MVDVNVNIRIPGVEMLLKYVASGIGAVAGPMPAPWKARQETESRRISAEGQTDALQLITDAQRKRHVMPSRCEGSPLEVARVSTP